MLILCQSLHHVGLLEPNKVVHRVACATTLVWVVEYDGRTHLIPVRHAVMNSVFCRGAVKHTGESQAVPGPERGCIFGQVDEGLVVAVPESVVCQKESKNSGGGGSVSRHQG